MNTQYNIKIEGGQIIITSPYNPAFVDMCHEKGGKWNGQSWVLPDTALTRDTLKKLIGWYEGCGTKEITVGYDEAENPGKSAVYKAYTLCTRPYRDARVRQHDGVILVKGHYPPYGGSQKNPNAWPDADENGETEWLLTVFDGFEK